VGDPADLEHGQLNQPIDQGEMQSIWISAILVLDKLAFIKKGDLLLSAKRLADTLTLSRGFFSAAIIWLGLSRGLEALPGVVILTLIAWTTDCFDGTIARRSQLEYQTWIGANDLVFDLFIAGSLVAYLSLVSLLPVWIGIAFVSIWIWAFWRYGFFLAGVKISQAMVYGYLIVAVFFQSLVYGAALVVWIIFAVVATWPRFLEESVPVFFKDVRNFIQK
jgi:hypothetical protein